MLEMWKAEIEKNYWDPEYTGSNESKKVLEAEYETLKRVLIDIGLVK